MHKKIFFLMVGLLFLGQVSFAQKNVSTNEFRKKQLKTQMDYRFIGGFYGFESLFLKSVKYTDEASQNCAVGIMIATFDVDCNGVLSDVKIKNPLGYKLSDQISKFLKSTRGRWNKCDNDKYTHFEVPFMFTLKGTKTNESNAAFVYEGKNPGFSCLSDSYYLDKIEKALKKKKGIRARGYIETLIHRDPYNRSYYDLLEQAIKYSGKDKKKSHKKDKK